MERKKKNKVEQTIHYIWIEWVSSTGSKSSRLIGNRSMPVSDAKGDSDMKKAFKIFSIMFVIEIVLIAILDAMA